MANRASVLCLLLVVLFFLPWMFSPWFLSFFHLFIFLGAFVSSLYMFQGRFGQKILGHRLARNGNPIHLNLSAFP